MALNLENWEFYQYNFPQEFGQLCDSRCLLRLLAYDLDL